MTVVVVLADNKVLKAGNITALYFPFRTVERLLSALRDPRPRRAAESAAEAEHRGQVLRPLLSQSYSSVGCEPFLHLKKYGKNCCILKQISWTYDMDIIDKD